MKLKIYNDEVWIKDNTILPSNFHQMNEKEKWDYIHRNKLLHRIDGPAIIWDDKTEWWYLNNKEVDEEIFKKIEESTKEELLMYMVLPKYKDYISLIEYRLNII